jgi:hypothetical protein
MEFDQFRMTVKYDEAANKEHIRSTLQAQKSRAYADITPSHTC